MHNYYTHANTHTYVHTLKKPSVVKITTHIAHLLLPFVSLLPLVPPGNLNVSDDGFLGV